jgi:hypothetical protein
LPERENYIEVQWRNPNARKWQTICAASIRANVDRTDKGTQMPLSAAKMRTASPGLHPPGPDGSIGAKDDRLRNGITGKSASVTLAHATAACVIADVPTPAWLWPVHRCPGWKATYPASPSTIDRRSSPQRLWVRGGRSRPATRGNFPGKITASS